MSSDRQPVDLSGTALGVLAVGGVVLAALVWFFRPWVHGIVYLVYTTPMALLAVVVAAPVAVAAFRRLDGEQALNVAGGVFLVLLVVGAGVAGTFAAENLGKETMQNAETTDELLETDAENPRVVTKAVADRFASNTLNFPQYRVSKSDITVYNGSLYWSYALAPDGLYNRYTKKQHGTVLVDMTEQNAEVKTFEGDLKRGIGTAFYSHYKWKLLKNGEYLVDYEDPFMVVHDEEQYIAVPYTRPEFHLLPLPHTTPEWAGVALVDSDGEVTDLSPQEARSNEVLSGQRLYPFDLARDRVAATKYRNGIINTFTSHEDEVELAPVPGENNDQPFMVLTEEGPKYVVAVEPYGDAQGLKEIWLVDARTGNFERYAPEDSLFGPRKAADFVRQAARTTDWNRFDPSEPIPAVVDGELYWEVRVVPRDNSGIAYIAFVNAQTSDVAEVETTDQVVAFMEGRQQAGNQTGDAPGREPTIIVQRVAENGTVVGEMEVYGNESVRVVPGNATGSGPGGNRTGG